MSAARIDIVCEQGADLAVTLVWQGPDSPVDLTGYQARMQVKAGYGDAQPLLEFTDGNGRIELGGAEGTVTLKLTAAETGALEVPLPEGPPRIPPRICHVYDLELVAPGGTVTRMAFGLFTVTAGVTT